MTTTQHVQAPFTLSTCSNLRRWGRGGAALAASILWLACGSPPPAQTPATDPELEPERSAWPEAKEEKPETVVHAEFQTSATAIRPGGKFLLAVRFDITPEYRISWSNPGDVGKSTRVSFKVPDGFVVGPLQFPAPTRYELPGKLVNWGYMTGTAVFAEVTAPARLSQSEAYRFDVRADWLACKDDCATESLDAWFELVATPSAPEPALPDELRAHHDALPRPITELPESTCDWAENIEQPSLTLTASEVKWKDFLLADAEQPKVLRMRPSGDELQLRFAGRSEQPLRGLAVAELEGKVLFFDVTMPWPSDEVVEAPPASAKTGRAAAKEQPKKSARKSR